ncbi:MAG TPA: sigma-70 family RNA polymerase sigma factor [Brevundimonas sp.]|nr:sigma-70 family RNA polymerase sigma factor [Brevundimonas sp.]
MPRGESSEALARLFDDHVWDVYGFAAYRLGNRADAEDITQQTFERALKAWGRFDPSRATPRTWLLAIARNLVIDHHRRDRSYLSSPIGEGGVAEEDLPAAGEESAGVSPELADAFETLSERALEVVALRFGGDLRGPEIAEMLDLRLATVQQILSRSLRKLRTELEGPEPKPVRRPRKKPKAKAKAKAKPKSKAKAGGSGRKRSGAGNAKRRDRK